MKIRDREPSWAKTSRQKPFSNINNLNDNKKLKLRYEIKINLIKKELLRSRKNKAKIKTEGNAKGLFILNPDKWLFNGLGIIKNMKNNESWYHENVFLEK